MGRHDAFAHAHTDQSRSRNAELIEKSRVGVGCGIRTEGQMETSTSNRKSGVRRVLHKHPCGVNHDRPCTKASHQFCQSHDFFGEGLFEEERKIQESGIDCFVLSVVTKRQACVDAKTEFGRARRRLVRKLRVRAFCLSRRWLQSQSPPLFFRQTHN